MSTLTAEDLESFSRQPIPDQLTAIRASLADLHTKLDSLIDKKPEVEPCPVCGGSKILNENLGNESQGNSRFIKYCHTCFDLRIKGNAHIGPSCPTPQEALAAWNKQSRELRGLKP